MEEELDSKPFYEAVCHFYVASIQKMLKKFQFRDSILKDFGSYPDQVSSYNFSTIERLAKCFPQLNLKDTQFIDSLGSEFMDYKLSPAELPSPSTYKAATNDDLPRPGKF